MVLEEKKILATVQGLRQERSVVLLNSSCSGSVTTDIITRATAMVGGSYSGEVKRQSRLNCDQLLLLG
jgi:hypothetical protein